MSSERMHGDRGETGCSSSPAIPGYGRQDYWDSRYEDGAIGQAGGEGVQSNEWCVAAPRGVSFAGKVAEGRGGTQEATTQAERSQQRPG